MNVLSLYAGIGGIDLGLEWAGFDVVGQVEADPFCLAVLAKHWPGVPRHDDVRTCVEWWESKPRPRVDVVAGGFPCQPVSLAGRRLAEADDRWAWPDMCRVVRSLRPRFVFVENVSGLLIRAMGGVLGDLAACGYDAAWDCIPASAVGAPHFRDRVWIIGDRVANADGTGRGPGPGLEWDWPAPVRDGWWAAEPDVGRVALRVPGGVDRLRALGNSAVPHVAEYVGRRILDVAGAVA